MVISEVANSETSAVLSETVHREKNILYTLDTLQWTTIWRRVWPIELVLFPMILN